MRGTIVKSKKIHQYGGGKGKGIKADGQTDENVKERAKNVALKGNGGEYFLLDPADNVLVAE